MKGKQNVTIESRFNSKKTGEMIEIIRVSVNNYSVKLYGENRGIYNVKLENLKTILIDHI